MELSYQENYWDVPELKTEFMSYLLGMFGLDLSSWDKLGYWDQAYRPFSYFNGQSLVSNVCIYSLDMTVQGNKCRVAQISAVGTLSEYRQKGLSSQLTRKAIDWARDNHDFFFLFADEDAYEFYEKGDFRHLDEYKARISVSGMNAKPGLVKLDVKNQDHLRQIYRFASEREPVSDILGVSSKKLFMFWCLNPLKDYIHYIAELDILILFKRVGELTTIFDIVGKSVPPFSKIYPYLCGEIGETDETDGTVEFLFMVDKLDLESFDEMKIEDNGTHVRGDFPLEGSRFIFPFTAQA